MHVTTLARRLGSVALVASLALGTAACSGDSGGSSEGTDSSSSTDEGSAEESTDEGAEESTDEAPEELSAEEFFPTMMTALEDAESFRFTSTTTAGGASQEVSGEGRFTDAGAEIKASTAGAQAMEMIMVDQVLYIKSEQMGLGDKWMKVDLREQGDSLFGFLAKASDPQAMMQALESPEKLELIGTEDVDGVTANHYRVTIDSQEYASAMGLPAEMGSFLPEKMVQDMWLDAENRPVKYVTELETPAADGGNPTTTSTEGLYHDFGVDVQIEAPPASETTDAPALPGAA